MTKAKRRLAAVPDGPLRAVLYIRVSALMGRGGDDFHSPEVQLGAMRRKTVGMQEVEVVDCDIDRPASGDNAFMREGIDRVRELAQARKFDVLVVYNVARFGRNTLESLKFLSELANLGVTIMSAKQHIDTSTPSGRKQLTDLLAGAQLQAEEIGETWSDIIDQRARSGDQHGYAPFGYDKVNKVVDGVEVTAKRFVIDPVTGPIMKEIFARYADGDSTMEVSLYYYAMTGQRIDTSNIKVRLRNAFYIGMVNHAGEIFPGNHEPLIDEVTWEKVQDRMARDRVVPPRHVNPTWAMVGLIYHLDCALVQRLPHVRRNGKREQRLICGRSKARTAGGCDGIGAPALDKIEQVVLSRVAIYIEGLRSDPAARARYLATKASARADAATLERELKNAQQALTKLTTRWAREQVGDAAFNASFGELRDAEAAIRVQLQSARKTVEMPDPLDVANAAEAMLTMWPEMTMRERNRALRDVVKRITVRKAVRYREPEEDRVHVEFL